MMLSIQPFRRDDVPAVKKFTDEEIGTNYYRSEELVDFVKKSQKNGETSSFVLYQGDDVKGVRLSFPQGQWSQGKGGALMADRWPHALSETAYFQSLFIAKDFQRQGWGRQLSNQALAVLKKMGAKGVVCHSWVESPGESSLKALRSLGFVSIARHPFYWREVDYQCPRCGSPCLCTAEEMYYDLKEGEQ